MLNDAASASNGATLATANDDVQSFMVSAPGKVIVFGEHAVVHGKAAMAASVSLRSYLHVEPGPITSKPSVTLNFTDIDLSHSWTIASLPWPSTSLLDAPVSRTLDPALVSSLHSHLDAISLEASPTARKIHAAAASTFLYLFLLLSSPSSPSLTFTLRSTIPIGAGLGSSASISVCLATALLHLSGTLPVPTRTSSLPPSITIPILDKINALAFLGESLIHGTPSGVDNTVSTLGKAVVFRRPRPGAVPLIDPIAAFPELPLLVVDTRQPKSTAVEVAKVRALRDSHPAVVGGVLDAIDAVTVSARTLVAEATTRDEGLEETGAPGTEARESGGVRAEAVERLGELVRLNHGLLTALGVSHPRLEELREVVDASGAGWFKLTGAGGGGCGFVLLRGDVKGEDKNGRDVQRLRDLEAELDRRGFARYETLLGGDGVGLRLFEPGREVKLETFLAAEGTAGLEALCAGEDAGWRYWRSE